VGDLGCPKSFLDGQTKYRSRRLAESGDYGDGFDRVFGQVVEGTLGCARGSNPSTLQKRLSS
jgi:hypothetical protein